MDNIFNRYKLLGLLLLISTAISAEQSFQEDLAHNKWLKDKYRIEHKSLIPVVAIADMFFACNIKRKMDATNYSIQALVKLMDRDLLAEKLSKCLDGKPINSTLAISYGLNGCFHEQLAALSVKDRNKKMKLGQKAVASLSKEEKLKSFTHCVTEQAINYLSKN